MILIIAGSLQDKTLQNGLARQHYGEEPDMEKYYDHVNEIENEVVIPLFDHWKHKFDLRTKTMRGEPLAGERQSARRAKQFGIIRRFQESYEENSKFSSFVCRSFTNRLTEHALADLDPEIPENMDKRFMATNITRLLKKFYLEL